jgi:hypothetical protein
MLSELIGMNRINNQPAQPAWFPAARHWLLRQLAQGVSILLGGFAGDRECAFDLRIVRREQNPSVGLDGEDAVPRLEMEAIGHVFRQGRAHRATGLTQRHFLRHSP